jgi:hypothetical protein
LITDVFRSRPLLCTIHHLINSTLASVENVPVVPAVLDKGHQSKPMYTDRMFSLVSDLDLLRQKVLAVGDVKLVLIDPISAYLGGGAVNSFRTPEVRAFSRQWLLSPLS